MAYLILALIALALFFGGVLIGRANRPARLPRPEKRELAQLEQLRDNLYQLSIDHMDVEPFAQIVFSTIRKSDKELEA